jgi:hypothetical protein
MEEQKRKDDQKKKLFEERLARLKEAFKCHSDGELAKNLGLKQQAVYAAKRRMKIPFTWLDTAAKKSISANYIMHGEGSTNWFENEKETDLLVRLAIQEKVISPTVTEVNQRPRHRTGDLPLPSVYLESVASRALFRLTLESCGLRLTDERRVLFGTYLRKHLLPKIVSDLAEEYREFAESLEIHDDHLENQEKQGI